MADPITLGIGALAGGAILGGIGSIMGGSANAANLQAQQNAANYNAQLYNQQASQAMTTVQAQSNQQARQSREVLGQQRAAIAESGIGFSGTGGDLIEDSTANAEFDRQNILYNGLLQSQGYASQAQQSSYEADIAGSQIGAARTAGYIGAASHLLSGFGGFALSGYRRGQTKYNSAG